MTNRSRNIALAIAAFVLLLGAGSYAATSGDDELTKPYKMDRSYNDRAKAHTPPPAEDTPEAKLPPGEVPTPVVP